MRCPHCGNESAESYKFCVKCGKSIIGNDATTELFPKLGPKVEPKLVWQASLKCAVALGLAALIVHFTASFLAGNDPNLQQAEKDRITQLASIKPDSNLKPYDQKLPFIQAAMTGGFLFLFLFTPMGIPRKGKMQWNKVAQDTFHQFLKGWSAIWVTWLVLYLYLGFVLLRDVGVMQNVGIQVTVDFLNVSNSAAFFYLFLVLDMPSVATKADPDRNREFKLGFAIICVICFLVFLASSLSRFNKIDELGTHISGVLVAISMAYVVGRLDSHYMNVSRWTLAPLYLYAVIQVVGPHLVNYISKSGYGYQTVFFATATILKIYLFFVINYWLQDGSFEAYYNNASKHIEEMRLQKGLSNA